MSGRKFEYAYWFTVIALLAITLGSALVHLDRAKRSTPLYSYEVVGEYLHDSSAFTQGLVFVDGFIYEGTGLNGRSSLRRVDLASGEVVQVYNLSSDYFGEGLTLWGDRIYQLTWQSNVGFVYDRESFELLETFEVATEGWGLTHDGLTLILSYGTSTLRFLDPETFEMIRELRVHDKGIPVLNINELEYIRGEIWANIWMTDLIARIDPASGLVVGWLDLSGLEDRLEQDSAYDVLNGIAYDSEGDRLFVTGKLWRKLFEIEIKIVK
jgi:glutamine cyclotransferase